MYFDDRVVSYLDEHGREQVYIRNSELFQSNLTALAVNLDEPSQNSQSNENERDTSSSADRGSTLNEMLLMLDGCKRGVKRQSNLQRPQSNLPRPQSNELTVSAKSTDSLIQVKFA